MAKKSIKFEGVYFAYDHGMEHGPTDFNEKSVFPEYIIEIAEKAEVGALILLKGAAKRYYSRNCPIPLILKLNQKTRLYQGESFSTQTCSVEEAIKLGASAVGYTIYFGSKYEKWMLREFGRIEEEASKYGVPTVMWAYPRGAAIKDDESPEMVAYAARAAMELGADVVKLKYPRDDSALDWIVKCAGRTRVFVAGGSKLTDDVFLENIRKAAKAGFSGVAVGRNVFQSGDPIKKLKELKEIFS